MLTPFQNRAQRALAGTPFFGELPADLLRWIHRTPVRRGDVLFEKGDASRHLYAVVGGQLKLFSRGEGGRELAHELIGPGALLGELGIVADAPRRASLVATAHSELATLDREELDFVCSRHPELRVSLSQAAAASALALSQKVEDAAFLSLEDRIEQTLADLAERIGEAIDQGVLIHVRQQDLADLLSTSRESVNRVLKSAQMRARFEVHRGSIVVLA